MGAVATVAVVVVVAVVLAATEASPGGLATGSATRAVPTTLPAETAAISAAPAGGGLGVAAMGEVEEATTYDLSQIRQRPWGVGDDNHLSFSCRKRKSPHGQSLMMLTSHVMPVRILVSMQWGHRKITTTLTPLQV